MIRKPPYSYHYVHCRWFYFVLNYGTNDLNTVCTEFQVADHRHPSSGTVSTITNALFMHERGFIELAIPANIHNAPIRTRTRSVSSDPFEPFQLSTFPNEFIFDYAWPSVSRDVPLIIPACMQAVGLRKVSERRNAVFMLASPDTYKSTYLGLKAYH